MKESQPFYLLDDEDRKRIDRMLSLIHLFVTELVEHRRLPLEIKDDTAFDEFEAYIERITTPISRTEEVPLDF
jgi:hypothetical protein